MQTTFSRYEKNVEIEISMEEIESYGMKHVIGEGSAFNKLFGLEIVNRELLWKREMFMEVVLFLHVFFFTVGQLMKLEQFHVIHGSKIFLRSHPVIFQIIRSLVKIFEIFGAGTCIGNC